jgi:hypothetical protein
MKSSCFLLKAMLTNMATWGNKKDLERMGDVVEGPVWKRSP